MSVRSSSRVWTNSAAEGTSLLVMLAIADYADDGGNAHPSVASLAKMTRMGVRNVNRILALLRAGGELEIRFNAGPRGTNRYRLVFDQMRRVEALGNAVNAGGVNGYSGVNGHSGVIRDSEVNGGAGVNDDSSTPESPFPEPLNGHSDEPSLNHQEPSEAPSTKEPSPHGGDRLPNSPREDLFGAPMAHPKSGSNGGALASAARGITPAEWRSRISELYTTRVVNGANHPLGPKGIKVMGPRRQREADAFMGLARERAEVRLTEALTRAQAQQESEPNDSNAAAVAAAQAALEGSVTDAALEAWLVDYFGAAAKDDRIRGIAKRGEGHEKWRADLSYVLREDTFTRILES
jgi:hypothetical protein